MAAIAKILNGVVDHNGMKINLERKFTGKIIGLYFSAHWCAQSKMFTTQLINFYKQYHLSKKFDIVYISGDENEEQFNDYWKEMPWLALSYQEPDSNIDLYDGPLYQKFNVSTLPTLVLLNADTGEIIQSNAKIIQLFKQSPKEVADKFPYQGMVFD